MLGQSFLESQALETSLSQPKEELDVGRSGIKEPQKNNYCTKTYSHKKT
jgi:hypothetical protein